MLSNGPELDPEKTARYAGQIHKLEDQLARYRKVPIFSDARKLCCTLP